MSSAFMDKLKHIDISKNKEEQVIFYNKIKQRFSSYDEANKPTIIIFNDFAIINNASIDEFLEKIIKI